MSDLTSLIAQFFHSISSREPRLLVSGSLLSPPVLAGMLGSLRGLEGLVQTLSKLLSGWARVGPDFWADLKHMAGIFPESEQAEWRQPTAGFSGHRSKEGTVLLWSIGEAWPKKLWLHFSLYYGMVLLLFITAGKYTKGVQRAFCRQKWQGPC